MGLLRPSFIPPPQIRALRDLARTRLQLARDRTREWQRHEKLPEGILARLSSVARSLAKTGTARAVTEAIAGGETAAALAAIPAAWGTSAGGETGPDAGHGEDPAILPAAQRLAEIPGVSLALARVIIAETGPDMTRFPTADCLASRAGLAPVTRQSGPRTRKPQKGHGDDYLKGYCTQADGGAARTDSFPGERLRRLSRPPGGNKARCAVAHCPNAIISINPATTA